MKKVSLITATILFICAIFMAQDCKAKKIKPETYHPPKDLKFGMSKAEVESTLKIQLRKTQHKMGGFYKGKISISNRERDTLFKFINDSLLNVSITLESGKNIKSNDYDHYKSVLESKYGDPTEDWVYSSMWVAVDGTNIFLNYDYSSVYNKVWLLYTHPRFFEEQDEKRRKESKEF